jgi:phosphopantetheine--protein transferase-like protein
MIGIDVVDVARLAVALERTPSLETRLFTEAERGYCNSKTDPVTRFAGTMAAKEAVIKALRLGPLNAWARRIEITREPGGEPYARVEGRSDRLPVSISHDGGVAVACALALPGLDGVPSELVPESRDHSVGKGVVPARGEAIEQRNRNGGRGSPLIDRSFDRPATLAGILHESGDTL